MASLEKIMELKAWVVIGKKKSFWGKETQRWMVGVVDTVTEAHQNVNMLNKWSEDQLKRNKNRTATLWNPPLLSCPWDVKWTLSDAKRIEYSFQPLFVFPNYCRSSYEIV